MPQSTKIPSKSKGKKNCFINSVFAVNIILVVVAVDHSYAICRIRGSFRFLISFYFIFFFSYLFSFPFSFV